MLISLGALGDNAHKKVAEISGVNAGRCMQCGTCSSVCPMVEAMDVTVRQTMLFLQHGQAERLVRGAGFQEFPGPGSQPFGVVNLAAVGLVEVAALRGPGVEHVEDVFRATGPHAPLAQDRRSVSVSAEDGRVCLAQNLR